MLRGQSGLLTQFASRRDRRIFAREVEQSAGNSQSRRDNAWRYW